MKLEKAMGCLAWLNLSLSLLLIEFINESTGGVVWVVRVAVLLDLEWLLLPLNLHHLQIQGVAFLLTLVPLDSPLTTTQSPSSATYSIPSITQWGLWILQLGQAMWGLVKIDSSPRFAIHLECPILQWNSDRLDSRLSYRRSETIEMGVGAVRCNVRCVHYPLYNWECNWFVMSRLRSSKAIVTSIWQWYVATSKCSLLSSSTSLRCTITTNARAPMASIYSSFGLI